MLVWLSTQFEILCYSLTMSSDITLAGMLCQITSKLESLFLNLCTDTEDTFIRMLSPFPISFRGCMIILLYFDFVGYGGGTSSRPDEGSRKIPGLE